MSSRWFRLYDGLLDDPNVQRLPAETFKALVNLWCLASRNGGDLPSVDDIAFSLRVKADYITNLLKTLELLDLIDRYGDTLKPHNWNTRQFQSDVSTERVQRFRKRRETVSETANETPPEQIQIQSRTEQKKGASAPSVINSDFDDWWKLYPRKVAKGSARKAYLAALKKI